MIAAAGGNSIPCAPYATFGTRELSEHVAVALKHRKATLLQHHGLIAVSYTHLDVYKRQQQLFRPEAADFFQGLQMLRQLIA